MHRSVRDITGMKGSRRISAVTSYDYTMAALCDRAGIDVLLVGDSAGMVMLGYDNTIPVTMEQMCMFTEAVSNARNDSLVVADMPFMSYQSSHVEAIRNAGRLIKSGADAVKLEGGAAMSDTVRAIVDVGIPVMGHVGLQPQTTMLHQGYRMQGSTADAARTIMRDAVALEDAGAFAIVLEMVSSEAAHIITHNAGIPTIGIGSGAGCDGQVLVLQDLLGMYEKIKPKFARRYMNLADEIVGALARYKSDVETRAFPSEENWFAMDPQEAEKLRDGVGG